MFFSIYVTFCMFNQCCLIDFFFRVSVIYYSIMFNNVHITHFYILVYFFLQFYISFWLCISIFHYYVLILFPWKLYFYYHCYWFIENIVFLSMSDSIITTSIFLLVFLSWYILYLIKSISSLFVVYISILLSYYFS